ncbi:CDP-glycerol glycerophosphotransferase family protein [Bacillus sp. JCM 19041]|uniref:CDP-glycerol glycerophosphotransferase family protein n=1 Tax=Bacillus sp. JCM 19041 TaxID=1460637 RepID=UPI0006D07149
MVDRRKLGKVAQDNGFAFFEYCVNNNEIKESKNIYYVSEKDNKNKRDLEPYYKNVVIADTFKHLILYELSSYLIVSHGIRDVLPSIMHTQMRNNHTDIVYLQHGIVAMKKLGMNGNSYSGKIRKFVVSSEHERDIFIRNMNFRKDQIIVTGLARFDKLNDASSNLEDKEILLMPTWRDWVNNSRATFLDSPFYTNYIDLLNDPKLHRVLEENKLVLKFFPHFEIQTKYKNEFNFSHPRVKMVRLGEETVQELMQKSSLMITDYSSVAFDFNYLNKPVMFYQFDIVDYLHYRGSYVNLKTDLFGDVTYSKERLIKLLEKQAKNGFSYSKHQIKLSRRYYKYQDRLNSERIYKEIEMN